MNSTDSKTWPCLTCGYPIRVNPHAGLGEPRYVHVSPGGHLALRGPNPIQEGTTDES